MLLFLAGCGGLPQPDATGSPPVTGTPPEATATRGSVTPGPVETAAIQTPRPPGEPTTLRIWLPPQFDPMGSSRAAKLLQSRLNQFEALHPGLKIEVRVKALEGIGGMLDSLSAANAAAPLSLPDLVALPRSTLEAAALKGLLYPYHDLAVPLENEDWYDYALQLARLETSTFGLPFAGDALMMVYRPSAVGDAPHDWATTLTLTQTLAFPASESRSLVTLALYQSEGGIISDEQGRPVLDVATLTQVLTYYQQAEQTGLMPYWLTQYDSDEQIWELYTEGKANLAVTWASRYLSQAGELPDIAAALLPTADGSPYSLASGWVWALSNPAPERQALGAQLAQFLTGSAYLAEWTAAAGYLPPRASALAAWHDPNLRTLVDQLVLSAHLYPSADVLASLGPPLQQAVVQVLKQQSDPLMAAQEAADYLNAP